MHNWKVIYYETKEGSCSVQSFIDSRSINNRAKIFSMIAILEEIGPTLPRPYADLLKNGIHELRVKLSGDQVRFLYFFCYKDFIVLTHAFIKNTGKVPEKEINKALKYKSDFLKRFTESQIREEYNEDI
jgi:phage-related protein